MKYSYLLFDLDGTLFDYDRAESEALRQTFLDSEMEYHDIFLQEYRKINKQIWLDYEAGKITQNNLKTERFLRLGRSLDLNIEQVRFSGIYLKNLSQGRFLLKGVPRLLSELSLDPYRMFLITNGLKDVQRERLAGSEITKFFSDIFISEEIGAAKPDKAIFDESFRRMGDPDKSEVLLIGDSLSSDIAGGCSYGIDTCWINPGNLENKSGYLPTYTIKSVEELRKILQIREKSLSFPG